jgi:MarR family transcriptional repressor of emrRAB
MTIIQLKTLRYYNLNLTATEALLTLAKLGTTDMTGLASEIGVSTASVTKIVDRLCKQNLMQRRSTRDDRRCVFLDLTEKGAARIYQITGSYPETVTPANAAPAIGLRYAR